MTPGWRCWYWKLCEVSLLAMGGAIASLGDCALAQITPDSTLPNNSVVTPQGNTSVIEGGTQAGSNLFHSFEEFSVPTGGAAYFNNALNVQNIFSRVTGESISKIDGLLRANGTANLFLLNPNGIIFGPNASLNIGGSFVGSTASSLNFADGTQLGATNPQAPPLLTVSVPIGLQYGGTAGRIVNQSQATNSSGETVGLAVQTGKTLALLGGDVLLDGGNLQAPGGRVELGGVASSGTVGLAVDSNNLGLSFPDVGQRADVSLTNGASVNVSAGGGGSIALNARNLDFLEGSTLSAGIAPLLGSVSSQAGDITLNATGEIKAAGSDIFNRVQEGAVGKAGNVNITTGSLFLTNGATLNASTGGKGNGGSVNILARDTVSFDGERQNGEVTGAISVVGGEEAFGNAGSVNITTGSLSLTNGALLNVGTFGKGNAGSVTIVARDTVSFDGESKTNGFPSGVLSWVGPGGFGNGGSVNITTGSLSLTNGAQVLAQTFFGRKGNAGSVTIFARDTVSFEGQTQQRGAFGGVFNNVEAGAIGNAGDIRIETGSFSLKNGAQVVADIKGVGNAGRVTINAHNTVWFDGENRNGKPSGVFSFVDQGGIGKAGNIKIETGSLFLTNGGLLNASTLGQGNGGSVTINARDTVVFDGDKTDGGASAVLSLVGPEAKGNGGDVNIRTRFLSLTNGGRVIGSTNSRGDGGNVTILASDAISFDGVNSKKELFSGVFSTVDSRAEGNGGDVNITTRFLSFTNGGRVFVTVEPGGTGKGGDITVTARSIRLDNRGALSAETASGQGGNMNLQAQEKLLLRHGSQISTNAGTEGAGGDGGNINIDTDLLVPLENSDITANAFEGRGGNIQINTQGLFLSPDSGITASSEFGVDGEVEINTPDVDPTQGLVELPVELVDASRLIATSCGAGGENEFIVTGRGGLPPSPTDPLTSDAVWTDLRTFTQQAETKPSSESATNTTIRDRLRQYCFCQ